MFAAVRRHCIDGGDTASCDEICKGLVGEDPSVSRWLDVMILVRTLCLYVGHVMIVIILIFKN